MNIVRIFPALMCPIAPIAASAAPGQLDFTTADVTQVPDRHELAEFPRAAGGAGG